MNSDIVQLTSIFSKIHPFSSLTLWEQFMVYGEKRFFTVLTMQLDSLGLMFYFIISLSLTFLSVQSNLSSLFSNMNLP